MFPLLIPALTAVAGVLGGAAKGASDGRKSQADYNAVQDQTRTSQYSTQQQAILRALEGAEKAGLDRAQLDLLRRQFGLQAPAQRMQNATRGSMLANTQDVQISHPRATIPTITGGVRPSNLTPEARQLGQLIARQSLMDQMKGDTFADVPMQNWSGSVLAQPGTTAYPKASGFEKFASIAGLIGSGLGGVNSAISQYTQKQPPNGYLPPSGGGWTPPNFGG